MRLVLLLFFFQTLVSYGQDELEKYWRNAGCNKKYPESNCRIDFKAGMDEFTLSPDQLIAKIIRENPDGALVYFKKGAYVFSEKIRLPSNFELQGESAKATKLIFNLTQQTDAIYAQGKRIAKDVLLMENPQMGDSVILCPSLDIEANDWIVICDDDNHLITSQWANRKTGQMSQVKAVKGDSLFLTGYIKRDYKGPVVASKVIMVENIKVTNLSIINNTQTEQHTANIRFSYASNCIIYGVSSAYSNYAHVLIEYAAHCEIQKSQFQLAHDYGNGGKAYGVVLQFMAGECLIKDNQFKTLRHAILLQAGASANRIELNHSTDPYWEGVFLPKHSAGDIVLHGNYPYLNLIQQNTCQNLIIDNSHGFNGPDNVFRFNAIESYGLVMNKKSAVAPQYFIQNEISGKGLFKGKFRIKGKGHVTKGNIVKGKLKD